MSLLTELKKGIWEENPVLVLLLGMCPTLAVTSNAMNGMMMGLATMCVLLGSNCVVSLMRNVIPKKVRIPCYIVIIATFVTIIGMLLEAYAPAVNKSLGIFIPLIVVNCIVLGRAEAFASKNGVVKSGFDAIGMGIGFTLALVILGGLREFVAGGEFFAVKMIPAWETKFTLWTSAPGAFIILGLLIAGMNYKNMKKAEKEGKEFTTPLTMNCHSCQLCDLGKDNKED